MLTMKSACPPDSRISKQQPARTPVASACLTPQEDSTTPAAQAPTQTTYQLMTSHLTMDQLTPRTAPPMITSIPICDIRNIRAVRVIMGMDSSSRGVRVSSSRSGWGFRMRWRNLGRRGDCPVWIWGLMRLLIGLVGDRVVLT